MHSFILDNPISHTNRRLDVGISGNLCSNFPASLVYSAEGMDSSFVSESLPNLSTDWPQCYIHHCFIKHIVINALLSSLLFLPMCSLVRLLIHSSLNKFFPYDLHVVSTQDMEKITQTLHSSCLQTSRENSQGNAAF